MAKNKKSLHYLYLRTYTIWAATECILKNKYTAMYPCILNEYSKLRNKILKILSGLKVQYERSFIIYIPANWKELPWARTIMITNQTTIGKDFEYDKLPIMRKVYYSLSILLFHLNGVLDGSQ
jgi:hypothetical protein